MYKIKAQNRTQTAIKSFVPPSLIAGAVPVARGASPIQVAYNAASLALDTERVCLIFSIKESTVYYLAGAASDFASQGPVSTLLAMALPGVSMHQGMGAYYCRLDDSGLTACVITSESGMKCFIGSEADAERFPSLEREGSLPVYSIGDRPDKLSVMPTWRSFSEYERADNRRLLQRLLVAGAINTVVMGCLWIGVSIYIGKVTAGIDGITAQTKAELTAAAEKFNQGRGNRHPAWSELQEIARFAIERQGRIAAFKLENGKVSWTLSVPEFTTGEEIGRAFGSHVETRREGGVILIRKGGGK